MTVIPQHNRRRTFRRRRSGGHELWERDLDAEIRAILKPPPQKGIKRRTGVRVKPPLNQNQKTVLSAVGDGVATASEIARQTGISPSTTGGILRALCARNLVIKRGNGQWVRVSQK